MSYATFTTEINPFIIENKSKLMFDQPVLNELSNQELINYFISCIDEHYPYKNERQNMIYNTSIFILTQSLELNLYNDRREAFIRIFDILIPVLTRP